MATRGYKLQEFVAHSASVKCLSIGRKACRLFLTGGEDHRVNLWAIGKSTSLMSLCGHTSSVECVSFDSSEVLVLAGASSGTMKLWDVEEAKMVRTLTGHRSSCTAVEFHPFGEFFASGSSDTDLKIWDNRKKGCIHTYKGHGHGISTIKFTPDGRWVVSGGLDNVVKVWDLTAGKLLHDFTLHDGPITSIDFHPLEFLLATGSADRTVKFWDLETFEMIGSTRAEAAGVQAMSFHPDGRTLFCGYDKKLKVYSWEPIICHDGTDMGWSTLGDLCIHEMKLIGCSYNRNTVGIWAADLSLIKPYGTGITHDDESPVVLKADQEESDSSSSVSSHCLRSDADAKEIKNIYVDYEKPINPQKVVSPGLSKVSTPLESKRHSKLSSKKRTPILVSPKPERRATSRSFVAPNVVPRDNSDGKDLSRSRELFSPAKAGSATSVRPVHTRRASNSKNDVERPSIVESRSSHKTHIAQDSSFEDKYTTVKIVEDKLEKDVCPPVLPKVETVVESIGSETQAANVISKVAVRHGRTRSLVEKFERREISVSVEDQIVDQTPKTSPDVLADRIKSSTILKEEPQSSGRDLSSSNSESIFEDLMQSHDSLLSDLRYRLTKLQVVRHFWERNDYKGAIDAMKKLPDHSVQADVISVLTDKTESINLDLFSSLLPVLVNLLESNMERHAKMSLEMLLKLVAVYGQTICSTISAPPSVGVDLHQEARIECCRHCFNHLQKVQRALPAVTRRGSSLAKSALELNLVLQDQNIA